MRAKATCCVRVGDRPTVRMPVFQGVAALLCLMVWAAAPVLGDREGADPVLVDIGDVAQRVEKIGPHLYRLGAVTIDSEDRSVRCPGRVNMARGGPIELMACLPTGKVHESVLTLDVAPLDLQVALLLLGLEPGRNPGFDYPEGSPELDREPGEMVDVYVEWREEGEGEEEGRLVRRRAEELLYNLAQECPIERTGWVFIGSRWVEGRFGADLDGSLITTFYDPLAILELPLDLVGDDTWCVVKEDAVPPAGTQIELIVRRPPAEDAETAEGQHEDRCEPGGSAEARTQSCGAAQRPGGGE